MPNDETATITITLVFQPDRWREEDANAAARQVAGTLAEIAHYHPLAKVRLKRSDGQTESVQMRY